MVAIFKFYLKNIFGGTQHHVGVACAPKMLESVPAQLARVNLPNGEEATTKC